VSPTSLNASSQEVGRWVVTQRLGEPSNGLEVVVVPLGEVADGMGGEEVAIGFGGLELPGDVLDAILADVETETVGIVRPRATRTVEAAVLVVHHEECAHTLLRFSRVLEHVADAARGTPPGGGLVVLVAGMVA
jgi:hypothetical protein